MTEPKDFREFQQSDVGKRIAEIAAEHECEYDNGRCVICAGHDPTPPLPDQGERVRELEAEVTRLRSIMDRPDPHDFIVATEIEARYQLDRWGDEQGQPTAFDSTSDADFYRLIQHLATKAVLTTDEEGLDKRLHRITTVAAAACNWHMIEKARANGAGSDEGRPDA